MEMLSPPRHIERLVRQKRSGFYFKDAFEWTEDRGEARRFEDLLGVFEACYDCNLRGVELVLKDLDANFEIQLDLDGSAELSDDTGAFTTEKIHHLPSEFVSR